MIKEFSQIFAKNKKQGCSFRLSDVSNTILLLCERNRYCSYLEIHINYNITFEEYIIKLINDLEIRAKKGENE
jgi:hypothetical protein